MKIWKMYNPRFDSYYMEKVLTICGVVSTIIAARLQFVLSDTDIIGLSWAFSLAFWYIRVMYTINKFREGYIIEKDAIYFRYRFLKRNLYFKDIQCIIISNAQLGQGITHTPWVTIIGGKQNEVIDYCISCNKKHVLTSENIKYKLGAEIGYYHPGNVWEMFKKGSASIHNYDFIWNKREMHKIFEGFKGNYYIAASVISSYNSEFDNIVKRYDIANERIHIIDDSTNGKFIWRL